MFKISKNTYHSRLKRGWSIDRASKVVPIKTTVGVADITDTVEFTYITNLRRIKNNGYKPMFNVTCKCGNHFTVYEDELMYDIHCGCMGKNGSSILRQE